MDLTTHVFDLIASVNEHNKSSERKFEYTYLKKVDTWNGAKLITVQEETPIHLIVKKVEVSKGMWQIQFFWDWLENTEKVGAIFMGDRYNVGYLNWDKVKTGKSLEIAKDIHKLLTTLAKCASTVVFQFSIDRSLYAIVKELDNFDYKGSERLKIKAIKVMCATINIAKLMISHLALTDQPHHIKYEMDRVTKRLHQMRTSSISGTFRSEYKTQYSFINPVIPQEQLDNLINENKHQDRQAIVEHTKCTPSYAIQYWSKYPYALYLNKSFAVFNFFLELADEEGFSFPEIYVLLDGLFNLQGKSKNLYLYEFCMNLLPGKYGNEKSVIDNLCAFVVNSEPIL